jgi:hypothetical protein
MATTALVRREACPSCASTETRRVTCLSYSEPGLRTFLTQYYGGRADLSLLAEDNYEIHRCLRCGLGFQRGAPGEAILQDLYDRWIPPTELERTRVQFTLATQEYLAQQVQFLLRYFRLPPHHVNVLDFGLGWAEWATMARAFGCRVSGAELSQERIANAQRLGIEMLSWDEISRRRFHFINTEQVFEHLVSPRDTLEHLSSSLLPGGILKFSVPDSRAALRKLERGGTFESLSDYERMAVHPLEHINCFEHTSIVALARLVGLRPLTPSFRLLFDSATGWFSLRTAPRQALRAIYRHWYPKNTFVYLEKPSE